MKTRAILAAVLAAATLATPALAEGVKAKVVERDSRGHPTKVEVEGQVYAVCQGDQSDGCINPREAGLRFGNNPINYWPGKPASER